MDNEEIVILEDANALPAKPVAEPSYEKHTHTLLLKDCPVTAVKIYNDRAEVKRQIKVKLVEGEQKILLKQFPATTIPDTSRVSGESESDVTILEVSYKTGSEDVKNDQTERQKLEKQLTDLTAKQRDLNNELSRTQISSKFVDDYAKSIIDVTPVNENGPGELLEQMTKEETLNKISKFVSFYREQLNKTDDKELKIREELEQVAKQVQKIRMKIAKQKPETTSTQTRELTILLTQSGSEHNIESILYVTYLVSNAAWRASYDVRVQSEDSSLHITYYGIINQHSTEAWRNAQISLSTANPSTQSEPPTLNPVRLGYKPKKDREKRVF